GICRLIQCGLAGWRLLGAEREGEQGTGKSDQQQLLEANVHGCVPPELDGDASFAERESRRRGVQGRERRAMTTVLSRSDHHTCRASRNHQSVCLRNRPESSQGWSSLALPDRAPGTVPFQRERLRYPGTQRGLSAATKLEDWIDYAIRSDCAPFSLAQFDNLAQKTRLSRLVVQAPWLCSLFRSRVVIARILMGFLYLAVLVPILNRFSAQARQE